MSSSARFRRLLEEMESKKALRREAKLVFEPADLEGLDDEDFKAKLQGMTFGVEFDEGDKDAGGAPVDVSDTGAGAGAGRITLARKPNNHEADMNKETRPLNDTLGLTSIIVSHDLDETFHIADQVIVLANGRIAAQGTPDEVRHSPDPLVQQFVTAAPEGPVRFHHPAPDRASDFGLKGRS